MAAIDFGQLAISNQPSFHYPFLFSYIGKPEMAQPLLKQLMQTFDASPTGYPGDEDNGSMSAWYIFNSLGFYPVTPGTGEYVIGMPLVQTAEVKLSNGKQLTIQTSPNKVQQQFIHEIQLNQEKHTAPYFTHQELLNGGTLDYQLGIVPNPQNTAERPFSLSTEN